VLFNAALFHMDFKNLQTSSYDGVRFIIGNAASATVRGVELESTWNANDYWTLDGHVTVLDAKFNEYLGTQCPIGGNGLQEDPTCVNGRGSFSGRRLERTPEMEASVGITYDRDITSNLNLATNFDVYYSGDFFVQNNYNPLGLQKEFAKFDARVALSQTDGSWQVSLVGRNIADERTIQHAYVVASDFITFGEGRKIFLEATKRW
jgi:iron complex outermembrane recepter protein